MDALLRQGMLWLQWLPWRVSLRPTVHVLDLRQMQPPTTYPIWKALPDVRREPTRGRDGSLRHPIRASIRFVGPVLNGIGKWSGRIELRFRRPATRFQVLARQGRMPTRLELRYPRTNYEFGGC
jgi:hypothetical protein